MSLAGLTSEYLLKKYSVRWNKSASYLENSTSDIVECVCCDLTHLESHIES